MTGRSKKTRSQFQSKLRLLKVVGRFIYLDTRSVVMVNKLVQQNPRVSSILIERFINIAPCYIEAKGLLNYGYIGSNILSTDGYKQDKIEVLCLDRFVKVICSRPCFTFLCTLRANPVLHGLTSPGASVYCVSAKVFEVRNVIKSYRTVIIFTNPSARAGYDTRSIFKRSLTGLNLELSFS